MGPLEGHGEIAWDLGAVEGLLCDPEDRRRDARRDGCGHGLVALGFRALLPASEFALAVARDDRWRVAVRGFDCTRGPVTVAALRDRARALRHVLRPCAVDATNVRASGAFLRPFVKPGRERSRISRRLPPSGTHPVGSSTWERSIASR